MGKIQNNPCVIDPVCLLGVIYKAMVICKVGIYFPS